MADRTQSTIEIAAEPGAVLDVIADFERYPEWAHEVTSATHLHAGAIKDHYVLEYDCDNIAEDGTGSVSWHLVRATLLKGLDGTYSLARTPNGTQVTYDLEVELTMPMIGLLKRKAEKHIINLALSELKKRVEG